VLEVLLHGLGSPGPGADADLADRSALGALVGPRAEAGELAVARDRDRLGGGQGILHAHRLARAGAEREHEERSDEGGEGPAMHGRSIDHVGAPTKPPSLFCTGFDGGPSPALPRAGQSPSRVPHPHGRPFGAPGVLSKQSWYLADWTYCKFRRQSPRAERP